MKASEPETPLGPLARWDRGTADSNLSDTRFCLECRGAAGKSALACRLVSTKQSVNDSNAGGECNEMTVVGYRAKLELS